MSAPVEFVVRGHASRREPAQTGTVTGAVESVDADPRAAIDRVTVAHRDVVDSVEQLRGAGSLRWSSGELRTWAERPWSADGTQQAVQHHASIGFTAVFTDTDEVGPWLGERLGRDDGLVVHAVAWGLAEDRLAALERDVRGDAVLDAVARAQAYADALGLGQVRPVVIADAGLLVAAPGHPAPGAARFALAAAETGGIELTPDAIEVAVDVEARFVADAE